jgi:hypothetical protein
MSIAPISITTSSDTAVNPAPEEMSQSDMTQSMVLCDQFAAFNFHERAPLGTTEMSMRSSVAELDMTVSYHHPIPDNRDHEFTAMGHGFDDTDDSVNQYPVNMDVDFNDEDYEFVCVPCNYSA